MEFKGPKSEFSQENLPKVGDTVSKYELAGITDYWMLVKDFTRVPIDGLSWMYDLQGILLFIDKERTKEYYDIRESENDILICHTSSDIYCY